MFWVSVAVISSLVGITELTSLISEYYFTDGRIFIDGVFSGYSLGVESNDRIVSHFYFIYGLVAKNVSFMCWLSVHLSVNFYPGLSLVFGKPDRTRTAKSSCR